MSAASVGLEQRQLGGSREVAAAGLWQQPVEESRAGGKSGSSKARPLRARLYLPLLPTLRIEIRIRIEDQDQNKDQDQRSGSKFRIKQESYLRKKNQEPSTP